MSSIVSEFSVGICAFVKGPFMIGLSQISFFLVKMFTRRQIKIIVTLVFIYSLHLFCCLYFLCSILYQFIF